ncbi:hypothetical protein LCGC14_0654120 [marine sediment metagenome]|uniref:CSD domain-containing protein n=1 Tax=marine sediment metagenome TaxID=412755 RepID=A0A0F9QVI5_9ZZZZ
MGKDKFVESDENFVNPYYFVPLQDKCDKKYKFEGKNALTGWIECELETKTPVFIPNVTNDDRFQYRTKNQKEIRSYDFCSYRDLSGEKGSDTNFPKDAVFSGSGIRGMIRSEFEVVTNSCLSTIDDKKTLFRRVTTPGHPGRINQTPNGDWEIIPCKKYKLTIADFQDEILSFEEGKEIWFKANRDGYITELVNIDEGKKGYFHQGEKIFNKKNESVFVPNKDVETILLDEDHLTNLLENIKLYRDDKVNLAYKEKNGEREHSGYNKFKPEKIEDLNEALVYYSKYGNHIYLGLANIGREVFQNNLKKIISNQEYDPCSSLNKLCTACKLFGFTGKEEQLASRIRFTDAIPIKELNENNFFKPGILKELSSPKLSASEFYLVRPKTGGKGVHLWNYDYAGNWKEKGKNKYDRNSFIIKEGYKPKIRGRKFYWHHKIENPPYISKEGTERNVGIRPLKPDIKFSSKIYFNNISEKDLKTLVWVVEIGNLPENVHKIGMGKPLGLGSLKIMVKKIVIRKITIEDSKIKYRLIDSELNEDNYAKQIIEYTRALFNKDDSDNLRKCSDFLGCSEEVLSDYLTITDFKNALLNIQYPSNVESDINYEWFMENKQIRPGSSGTLPIIHKSLPKNIKNPFLPKYISSRLFQPRHKPHDLGINAKIGDVLEGTVKFYNDELDYGFIIPDIGGKDVYWKSKNVSSNEVLNKGDKVRFILEKGEKGLEGRDIRKID